MSKSILNYIGKDSASYLDIEKKLIPEEPQVSDSYPTCCCCRADFERFRNSRHHNPPAEYPCLTIPIYNDDDDDNDDDYDEDNCKKIVVSNETRQPLEAQAIVSILCYMMLRNLHLKKLHKLAQSFLDLTVYGLIVTAADYPEISILSGLSQCYGAIPRDQIHHVDTVSYTHLTLPTICSV